MNLLYILISILLLIDTYCSCIDLSNLMSAVVIFRHGDRTPIEPYPNDPYKDISFWPGGFGQLTNRGKYQQYQLGQWLRSRYDGFISQKYSLYDIYIRSTDVDRTLMSAEVNLAGLYPPEANQTWNTKLKWQPIPIHTIPEHEDAVLAMKKPCARFEELQKELFQSNYFKNINHQLHDLFAYLTRYSGKLVSSLKALEYLYGTLFIEENNNYTLPNWTHSVFPAKMKPWAAFSFATNCYTTELAKLRTGPLFNEIIEHFRNISSNYPKTYHKLKIYSAHDTTIADVLNSLGLFEYHSPPYTSTILFELRQNSDGYFINIFYKNSSIPQNMTLKGCEFDCDFERFIDILKPITVNLEQWEKDCITGFKRFLHSSSLLVTVMVGLWLAVFMLVVGMYLVAKYFGNKDTDMAYQQIPNDEIA